MLRLEFLKPSDIRQCLHRTPEKPPTDEMAHVASSVTFTGSSSNFSQVSRFTCGEGAARNVGITPPESWDTVDGRNPANQWIGIVYSIVVQGFIPPRWCRISAINRICRVFLRSFVDIILDKWATKGEKNNSSDTFHWNTGLFNRVPYNGSLWSPYN